jgi:hypothetical protein
MGNGALHPVLLQDERVHGVDDHVLAAVHDQRRLADRLQIFERLLPRRAPCGDRLDLGRRDFLVDLGIAVLGAQPEALEELAARSVALLGLREMMVLVFSPARSDTALVL